jgi:AraC-like DNA-binding protein
MCVVAGHGHQSIDGHQVDVAPGALCWVAPGQEHDASGLEGVTAWTLAFCADAVEPTETEPLLLTGPPRHPWLLPFVLAVRHRRCQVALPPDLHEAFWAGLLRLERELETRPPGHGSAARALLMLLLLDIARQVSAGEEPGPMRSALIDAVFRFIEQHYQRPIGLRDVARAVHRSPAYLTDRVRRETGRPVLVWLIERRMAEARRLLWSSDLSTEQVALRSGFGDPRHFARQFRRLNGLPPQAWRAAQRTAERGAVATKRPKEPPRTSKLRAL